MEEFRTRDDELDIGIDDYPSYCDYDKKIHIDCAHNLKFSCVIGFEFTHANFFPLLYVNVMSKKFHNSIMKDKMVYKGNNIVGVLMNVPIFVGTFSVMTDFAVLENMDAYHDEGMGDVIFGEPFLREVGIKTKWFEWIITIYNDDDEVTYQMARSHPRSIPRTNKGVSEPLRDLRKKISQRTTDKHPPNLYKMSQPANDDFSQHLSDEESNHEDASDTGAAPKQQQQMESITLSTLILMLEVNQNGNQEENFTGRLVLFEYFHQYTAAEIQAACEKERRRTGNLLLKIWNNIDDVDIEEMDINWQISNDCYTNEMKF
ncbi:hypothetical protein Tco_1285976 [Tanacetum coccineum]